MIDALLDILNKRKVLYIFLIGLTCFSVAVISLFYHNQYTSYSYLGTSRSSLASVGGSSKGGGAVSQITSLIPFGPKAEDPNIDYAIQLSHSHKFLSELIVENDLLPYLLAYKGYSRRNKEITFKRGYERFQIKNLFKDSEINYEHPFIQDGAKIIRKHFRISTSVESSQIVASLNYYSPEFSHDLLTIIITKLNNDIAVVDKINSEKSIDYISSIISKYPQPAISSTLASVLESQLTKSILASSGNEYAFSVIDEPVMPLKKSFPVRSFWVISAFFSSLVFCFILIILEYYFSNNRDLFFKTTSQDNLNEH